MPNTSELLSLRLGQLLNTFHEQLNDEIAQVVTLGSDREHVTKLLEARLSHDNARISELEAQCIALEAERDVLKESHRPRHIVVIIDGDGVIFELDRIAQGHVGGTQAGRDLAAGLEHHFGSTPHRPLTVYLFLNKKGLCDTFRKMKRHDAHDRLGGFMVGFNEAATGFMVVDVGRNKEASDAKIKVLLEKEVTSPQNEFIVFGGCHDGGYMPNLNTHITRGFGSKLFLLQGYDKPAWVIENLKLPLIQIPGLFVKEKINIPTETGTPLMSPAPNSAFLPKLAPLSPSLSRFPVPESPSASSAINPWSRPGSRAGHKRSISSGSGLDQNSSAASSPISEGLLLQLSPVTRAIDHRRTVSAGSGSVANYNGSAAPSPVSASPLLQPLPGPRAINPSRELWKQEPKLCIFHYLSPLGCKGRACKGSHDYVLTADQLVALREHFLDTPCKTVNDNKQCQNDKHCLFGHKCPSLGECTFYKERKCKFKGEGMHVPVPVRLTLRDFAIAKRRQSRSSAFGVGRFGSQPM